GDEGQERGRHHHRLAHRHDDGRQEAHVTRTVEARRVPQLAWDAHEELPQQEDYESRRHERHRQRRQGVEPRAPRDYLAAYQQEVGDEGDGAWDHQRRQHHHEDDLAAWELDAGEGVACQRARDEYTDDDDGGDDDAVAEVLAEVGLGPGYLVVGPLRHSGDGAAIDRLTERHQRRRDHVQERRQRDDGADGEYEVDGQVRGPELVGLADPCRPGRLFTWRARDRGVGSRTVSHGRPCFPRSGSAAASVPG